MKHHCFAAMPTTTLERLGPCANLRNAKKMAGKKGTNWFLRAALITSYRGDFIFTFTTKRTTETHTHTHRPYVSVLCLPFRHVLGMEGFFVRLKLYVHLCGYFVVVLVGWCAL